MIVTLTDDEVRKALYDFCVDKAQGHLGEAELEDVYFSVDNIDGRVEDIESVKFHVAFYT